MRRSLALGLSLFSLSACEPTTAPPVEDAGRPDAPRDGGTDARMPYDAGMIGARVPEAEAAMARESCTFERGAMPWETIGEEFPIGDEIPIRHFILVMQENRSFDHYFGAMEGVDGIAPGMSNPDDAGDPVEPFHTDDYCVDDPHHGWDASHGQWGDGANDGFVLFNGKNGERAMGYLTEEDIPFYYDLYSRFAMSDHHHCSVLGPTWPNREYYLAATSFGATGNHAIEAARYDDESDGDHLIFQGLERAGVDWRIYQSTIPFVWGAFGAYSLDQPAEGRTRRLEELYAEIEAGELPEVAWVDPTWSVSGTQATDEHPPANPQIGEQWIRDLVTRVMASPQWAETAIIITYDEHGGFWDHVAPPEACPPGDFPAEDGGDFDRLGFRVPLVIVSPYSRAGYVSDRVTDHASIIRLLQARYLLPAMTGRDANAWPLLDMFDFAGMPFATPPTDLAEAPLDPTRNAACIAEF